MEAEAAVQEAIGRAKGHSCGIGMDNTEYKAALQSLGSKAKGKWAPGNYAPRLQGRPIPKGECVHKALGDNALQNPCTGRQIKKLVTRPNTLVERTRDRNLQVRAVAP